MSKSGWIMLLGLCLTAMGASGAGRGLVIVKDPAGRSMELYGGSYALLVGISDYTAGWPDLDSIPGELRRVEGLLESNGFQVVKRLDLDGQELRDAFQEFIDAYGYDPDNRLVFYFSGHGHTWVDGGQGYLVARDAPRPASRQGFPGPPFLRKTLQMSQILAWSRQMAARHALFLFDSCFSGTVFQTKSLPELPPHISRATALKVRQFITAGSAGEEVPARSVFTPAFVDALEYGWGDLNRDGYVTGMELGLYLESKVPQHARQSPQFGKHPDYALSRGDFVFALAPEAVAEPAPARVPHVDPEMQEAALGLTRAQRRRLQEALNERGFAAGPSDGALGARSRAALAAYQRSQDLEPTGYLTAEQWARLAVEQRRERSPVLPSQRSDWEPEMVAIRGGCFQMGSPADEKDRSKDERQHRACVEGFRIGKYEVTQAQWQAVMGDNPSHFKDCDACPVEQVSWEDVQEYLAKLNTRTGQRYRLPTEAEWEYACRGGRKDEVYCGGDDPQAVAWYSGNSGGKTHPVGGKQGNGFGLYDMSGNVWEWTCSAYEKDYGGGETQCVTGEEGGRRVFRAGSWYNVPVTLRAAFRDWLTAVNRNDTLGFRLAQDR